MDTVANLYTTQVNLSGLLEVLGHNLYSTPEVAVRELIQNAHDSCNRRRIEGGAGADDAGPEIVVGCDAHKKILWVEDTGAGLTRDEVVAYLATVGSGYTRVLREQARDNSLIGAFGLGFLTAYVIGCRVDLWSTSYKEPDKAVHFASDTGQTYVLEDVEARPVGTRVEIHLKEDYEDLAERPVLDAIMRQYCALLPLPVYIGEDRERINGNPPPWREDLDTMPEARKRMLRLEFAERFEDRFDPLCALPVDAEDGLEGEGLFWIHDASTYGNADNRRLAVFVRGMLVTSNERDLLPSWAGFMAGVFESDHLVPTASRESLQKNDAYYAAQAQLAREVTRQLSILVANEPEIWRSVMRRHNEAMRGAAICDDVLFDLLCDELTVPTSEGDLTLPQILQRSGGLLHLSLGEDSGAEEVVARTMGVPIVNGYRYGAVPFCAQYADVKDVKLIRLGTEAGNKDLFPPADIDADTEAKFVEWFGGENRRVVASYFDPAYLPIVVLTDREAELKQFYESDEADLRIASGALALARLYTDKIEEKPPLTVVVNLNADVVTRLLDASPDSAERAARLLRALADLLVSRHAAHSKVDLPAVMKEFSDTVLSVLE